MESFDIDKPVECYLSKKIKEIKNIIKTKDMEREILKAILLC